MGVRHLMLEKPPDLVLSGVNRGRNAPRTCIYSGTVAGAMEGTVLGIPSFALSQSHRPRRTGRHPYWDTAARHAPDIIRRVLKDGHAARRADQHQFPRLSAGRCSRASRSPRRASATRNCCTSMRAHDGRGNPYYWIAFSRKAVHRPASTAPICVALADNRIAVTPLRLDLTDEPFMTRLAELFD